MNSLTTAKPPKKAAPGQGGGMIENTTDTLSDCAEKSTAATLEAEAIAAVARGWSLTPLNGKRPLLPGWQKRPAATAEDVHGWIANGHNCGVRTGAASGLIVVDLDKGAEPPECCAAVATIEAFTGSGNGRHLYYALPQGVSIGNSAGKLGEHIDVRGDGGQVVLAGSKHPDTGALYRWRDGHSPDDIELAEAPAALIEALQVKEPPKAAPSNETLVIPGDVSINYLSRALTGERDAVARSSAGNRNARLNQAAFSLGQLEARGLARTTAEGALLEAAARAGLSEAEALATFASGWTAGTKEPRTVTPSTSVPTLAFLTGKEPEPEPLPDPPEVEPGTWPTDLLPSSGFLSDFATWAVCSAQYSNPSLAMGAALAALSLLTGRKVQTESGLRTNLYCLGVGPSGSGKDRPQGCVAELFAELGLAGQVADRPASAPGLEDALGQEPTLLLLVDEVSDLIASATQGPRDPVALQLSGMLCRLFSSAARTLNRRLRAIRAGYSQPEPIHQPHCCLLGNATPAIWDSMTGQTVSSGLLPRCIVIEADPRQRNASPRAHRVPGNVLAFAEQWRDFTPGNGNLSSEYPRPFTVPLTPEAGQIIEDLAAECDRLHGDAAKHGDESGCAVVARSAEHATRLALLKACSEAGGGPPAAITGEAAQWGASVARWQQRLILDRVRSRVSDSEQERLLQRVLAYIVAGGRKGRPHHATLKASKLLKQDFDKVIATLDSRNEIMAAEGTASNGRPRITYYARGVAE